MRGGCGEAATAFVAAAIALAGPPAGVATAGSATTAVFLLGGGASLMAKKSVGAVLAAELGRSGRTIVAADAPIDESAAVLGCAVVQVICRAAIASALGATELVWGSLDAPPAGSAAAALVLYVAGAHGELRGTGTSSVDPAAPGAAAAAVATLVTGTPHGLVRVESTPPGASVLVDGRAVGTTPVDVALPHGEHAVALMRGADVATGTLVVADAPSVAAFTLGHAPGAGTAAGPGSPGVAPPPKSAGPSRPLPLAGIALAAGGAVLGGVALGLLATIAPVQRRFDSDVDALPDPLAATDADLEALRALDDRARGGRTRTIAGVGLGIAGGVAFAAGVGLTIARLAGPAPSDAGSPATARHDAHVALRLSLVPDGGHLEAVVSW